MKKKLINLFYRLILSFIICYSIPIPINMEDKSSCIHSGQHSIQANGIFGVKNTSVHHSLNRTNEGKLREKRDYTGDMDIEAIQTTINDHKTMIEDNRIMIYNIINNSITKTTYNKLLPTITLAQLQFGTAVKTVHLYS